MSTNTGGNLVGVTAMNMVKKLGLFTMSQLRVNNVPRQHIISREMRTNAND